ncbi:phospholipase A2 Scol/Pla-like isoform X2 [Tachypleus tridentatus]
MEVRGRLKRSISDLGSVVKTISGLNPLMLIFYGNWCGLGGAGKPVDSIDECCMRHDLCYDRANDKSCKNYHNKGPYVLKYDWNITSSGKPKCGKTSNSCVDKVCTCDVQLAMCLNEHKKSYDATYSTKRLE